MKKPVVISPEPSCFSDDELPEGWKFVTILDACEVNPPKPSKDFLPADAPVTFVPMPAVDADMGAITNPQIKPYLEVRNGFTSFRDGDVIMAKITPCMENGKSAIVHGMKNGIGFGSTEFHVMRSRGEILPEYIYYYIRQESFRNEAESHFTGSVGQKRVPADFIKQRVIPLPPLTEQERIVAHVEALLTHINAASDRLSRVPLIMKKFREAVLAAACEGRLTEGWREKNSNEVPASQLLQQIKKIRQEQKNQNIAKKSKNIRDADVETTQEESVDLPDSWVWGQIQDITQVHLGGTPSRKESSYWGGAISWISSGEVANNRILTTKEKITDLGLQNSNAKLYPKGTVLIAMIGEGKTRGQSAILDIEATTNQNVAGLVFDTDKIFNEFVWLWALSQYEKTRAVGRGGEQPALNGEKVRNLIIALPPLAEQHEIVRRVGLLFERADAFDQEVAAAGWRCERLTQAVLGKAFAGKL